MKHHIEEFDHILVGTLMGDREKKFNSIYKNIATFSVNTSINKEDLDLNAELPKNSCHGKASRVNKD